MSQAAGQPQPFSALQLTANQAELEQRNAPRFTPFIRAAKLVSPSGEFLCVVSDVSDTGVSVRLFHPLPDDKALVLEMPNEDCVPLEPVWMRNARAGFRIAGPIDLEHVLQGKSDRPRRPTRVNLRIPVTLSGLTGRFDAELRNISLQGAQVHCTSRLAIDQRLRMIAKGFPEIETRVRWRSLNSYGLIFDSLFQFGDLARVVAAVQGGPVD